MSKFVLVETLSQYRMRYVIEVPDNHNDGECPCTAIQWAEDTVTMEQMQEFSQKWIGETILSSREVSKKEIIPLCDEDNDYAQSWDNKKKLEVFVTPIGYKSED
jgi:hypothetical protein